LARLDTIYKGATLKKYIIQYLLLFSLSFNIAHDTILATKVEHSASVEHYVLEQSSASHCEDGCDLHHCFHFMAILEEASPSLLCPQNKSNLQQHYTYPIPPFKQSTIKPPIA